MLKTDLMITEKGEHRPLPPWSWPANANGRIAQHANEVRAMLALAEPLDTQNRALYEYAAAKLARSDGMLLPPPPVIANNEARLARARQSQAQLRAIKTRIAETVTKSLVERDGLRAGDFAAEGKDHRKEMRERAARMTGEERNRLLKSDPALREAVLEYQPWLSGMAQSEWDLLNRVELERRHGPRLHELEQEIAAYERALELHKTVELAITNELTTVGGDPAKAPPVAPPPAWELVIDPGTAL